MRTYQQRRRGGPTYTLIAHIVLMVSLLGSSAGAAENGPAAAASPSGHHLLLHFSHKKGPAGLPRKWDKRIPLPEGATVKEVKPPTGAAQTVVFSAPGDFDKTVAFYKQALPKAGFELGPEVKIPARKVYSLNFTRAGVQDTLAIFPDKTDPSKLAMRLIYTPEKGWVRTKLAKWEDRARILPKWWRHHEEQKREHSNKAPSTAPGQPSVAPTQPPAQ
jgi:hypothetical protein